MTRDMLESPGTLLAGLLPGVVLRVVGESLEALVDGTIVTALRAPGCLPDPKEGDTVLLFFGAGASPVATTVLASSQEGGRTMSFPGGIRITSDREIHLSSPRFRGVFADFSLSAGTLSLSGELLSLAGKKIVQTGQMLERVAGWLFDRAESSVREIETLDRHVAGATQIVSESVVSVDSESTILSSRDLVKIDGDQVHLG